MKRKLFAIVFVFCLMLSLPLAAAALDPLARVVDYADLLTDAQSGALEKRATDILYTYDMDVVILTVDSLGGKSPTAYADDFYDDSGYGIDGQHSGVLLLIAMDEREWAVSTCGNAIDAVTDWEIDEFFYDISGKLSDGEYYEAFDEFLTQIEWEYRAYIDESTLDSGDILFNFVIALAIGAVIAGIALLVMRSKMNTAKSQHGAESYIRNESYDLFRCQDIFLYSRTTRTQKSESSSGGSTHRSSSGRSHGGRSGRF